MSILHYREEKTTGGQDPFFGKQNWSFTLGKELRCDYGKKTRTENRKRGRRKEMKR
jgi:hypothetical protein